MGNASEVREVSGGLVRHAIEVVRHRCGDEAVDRLLEMAGEKRPRAVLEDTSRWTSHESVCSLFEAACELTGDPQLFRQPIDTDGSTPITPSTAEFVALMESVGSPSGIYQHVAAATAKLAVVVEAEPTWIGDEEAVVSYTPVAGYRRIKPICDYTAVMLSHAPVLFGFPAAAVIEEECTTDGAPRCVYRISWSESPGDELDAERRMRFLEAKVQMLAARFEALKTTAAELVRSSDVDETLRTIAENARKAARAPKHLLTVNLDDSRAHTVHYGMTDDEAAAVVASLPESAAAHDDASPTRLAVPVASARKHYGWMVAAHADGANLFLPGERALLASYAGIAAAALDAATAFRDARREAETATALLALASSLAEVGTRADIAQRLVDAVPAVVGSDLACVLVWDEVEGAMTIAALLGLDGDAEATFRGLRIAPSETPVLADMLERRAPVVIDETSTDPFVLGLMHMAGAEAAAVVPIGTEERVYGAVAAAMSGDYDRLGGRDHMMARLRGLASHGLAAFANADLLERIQHDATHDVLTGLPNQRLLGDRVERLLATVGRREAKAALVFVDLDGFKAINDTHGHDFGDALLREVAGRLSSAVRTGDTFARLGGDEFALLLPDADESAAAVAVERLLTALGEPFELDGQVLFIGASAGVAVAPDDGTTYAAMLKKADAAMYASKAEGRRRTRLGAEIEPLLREA